MIAPPIERVTSCPKAPPSNRQRAADWHAKVAHTDYPMMTGPRWLSLGYAAREYEREQMLDAAPSTDTYDYFEEVGYESH